MNIIGLKSQMDILGNFEYINDHIVDYPMFQKFNIIYKDNSHFEDFIEGINKNKTVSLYSKEYNNVESVKDIFDFFELPYLFIPNHEIEYYYE